MYVTFFFLKAKATMTDHDFVVADADAARTIPIRVGELKEGSYVVMNRDKPCKVWFGRNSFFFCPILFLKEKELIFFLTDC
jgi:hypothetical protein